MNSNSGTEMDEKANGGASATEVLNAVRKFFSSTKGQLVKIEVYLCLTVLLLAVIVVSGYFRRQYVHLRLFRLCIWAAKTVSYGLISYTMGLMASAPFHHELFAVWGVFLLVILARADSITGHSLREIAGFAGRMGLQMFWSAWLIYHDHHGTKFKLAIWFLWATCGVRICMMIKVSESMSGIEQTAELIAEFRRDREKRNYDDPITMEGYNFVVYGEKEVEVAMWADEEVPWLDTEKVVTIEKIWQCKGRLLGDHNKQLKDLCLSFALFKLLKRRIAGYPLPEADLRETRRFVKDELLGKEGDLDHEHERASRVLEAELAFLYDSLYTKHPAIFAGGFPVYKVIEILVVSTISLIVASALAHYRPEKEQDINLFQLKLHVYITCVIIYVIVLMELFEFLEKLFSDWNKVVLLCNYVKRSSWQKYMVMEWMLHLFCNKRMLWKRFHWKVDQYSFLESFDHDRPMKCLYGYFPGSINVRTMAQEYHRKKLPKAVSRALIDFLSDVLNRDGNVTNGTDSLFRNLTNNGGCLDDRLEEFVRDQCEFETHVEGIMVWHIATWLCEFVYLKDKNPKANDLEKNFLIANYLSKYCAYLVAFVPELLPDQVGVTKSTFCLTVMRAREKIRKGMTKEEKFGEMRKGEFSHILKKGAKLGRYLTDQVVEQKKIWKVLADFWVEKMVFVAPSDNADAHAKKLAKGGECVTLLWALLNHAGIVKPNSATPDGPVRTTQYTEIPIR